jgi:predicted NBD/HSP70 family sugar kinase
VLVPGDIGATGEHPLSIGLDIGATKTLAIALDKSDVICLERRVSTPHGSRVLMSFLTKLLDEMMDSVGGTRCSTVGVGVPGKVNAATGVIEHAVNLGITDSLAIGSVLQEHSGLPTQVENDVNAAALGAARLLSDGWPADLAYINVGTGLAVGLVLEGRLRRGASGVAGEVGHIPLTSFGPACACGLTGCLEPQASGGFILSRWGQSDIFRAAANGDGMATNTLDGMVEHLATAILIIALVVDTSLIVIGGGVAEAFTDLIPRLRRRIKERLMNSGFHSSLDLPKRIVTVPAHVPVGAMGAAIAARDIGVADLSARSTRQKRPRV